MTSNDEKLAEAVIAGENDCFLTPIVMTRMMGMSKTARACCDKAETCGYVVPRDLRLKDSGYLIQRKHRFIEAAVVDEWDNYYRSGRRVKRGHVPNQRNLTFDNREDLIALLEANPETRGAQDMIYKLKVEPVKGYKRDTDYNNKRR